MGSNFKVTEIACDIAMSVDLAYVALEQDVLAEKVVLMAPRDSH